MADPRLDDSPGELTPFAGLDELVTEFARDLQRALRDNFVGVYLIGSLAIGDFDLTSDVDLVVIANEEIASGDLRRVTEAHSRIRLHKNRWAKRLEYSVFPMAKLVRLTSPYGPNGRHPLEDRLLWYFNGDHPERSDHDNTLVTRWTLREKGICALGVDKASFAPEVTPDELRVEIKNSILGWHREQVFAVSTPHYNRFHQAFFVLNYCRALQDLHEGRISSKREGVAWAKSHLAWDWHELIDHCWQERQDPDIHVSQPPDPAIYQQVIAFADYATQLAGEYPL